jgi:hypothetical protein
MIHRECRDRLQVAGLPRSDWPDLSDAKQFPILSLAAWQAVMQLDEHDTALPAKFQMHLEKGDNPQLQIDLPTADALSVVPAGPADDFDLLAQPIKPGETHAGAIEHVHAGTLVITVWPLPATSRPAH